MILLKQVSALVVSCALLPAAARGELSAAQADQSASRSATQPPLQTPEEMQQFVAPIASYLDTLDAQILAASMYPGDDSGVEFAYPTRKE